MTVSAKTLKRFQADLKRCQTRCEEEMARRLFAAGVEFKAQMIIGFYIVDFAIPSKLLILECDGHHHSHSGMRRRDARRSAFLEEAGFRVLRVQNACVETFDITRIDQHPDCQMRQFRSALARANGLKGNALQRSATQ